jgi:hypothetical protein
MFFQKSRGGGLSGFLGTSRRGSRHRGRYGRQRTPQGGFFSSPVGRIGLGGLAFLAARRFLGRQQRPA